MHSECGSEENFLCNGKVKSKIGRRKIIVKHYSSNEFIEWHPVDFASFAM